MIRYPERMGRPVVGLPGRREQSAVLSCHAGGRRSAVRLERIIGIRIGIHIPHRTIHGILKDEELAENQPAKARQRKWVRYERRFSNSLWHTDYKQVHDGRWFIGYMDDASRLIVGFGVCLGRKRLQTPSACSREAIKRYGKARRHTHGSRLAILCKRKGGREAWRERV